MLSVVSVCRWLESTALSTGIRESIWSYPVIESLHVLTLCVFLGLTVLMDGRLVGLVLTETPVSHVMERLLPWIRSGFALMVVTGLLLFLATPVRFYDNVLFRLKLLLLVAAGHQRVAVSPHALRAVREWGSGRVLPRRAWLAGAISLVLWTAIVAAGRLVAYNWFE